MSKSRQLSYFWLIFFGICFSIENFIDAFSFGVVPYGSNLFVFSNIFLYLGYVFFFLSIENTCRKIFKNVYIKYLIIPCMVIPIIGGICFSVYVFKRLLFVFLFLPSLLILLISMYKYYKNCLYEKKKVLVIFIAVIPYVIASCFFEILKYCGNFNTKLVARSITRFIITLLVTIIANLIFKYFKRLSENTIKIYDYIPSYWRHIPLLTIFISIFAICFFISNFLETNAINKIIKNADIIVSDTAENVSSHLKTSDQISACLSNLLSLQETLTHPLMSNIDVLNNKINNYKRTFGVLLIFVLDNKGKIVSNSSYLENGSVNKIYLENESFFKQFELEKKNKTFSEKMFIEGKGYYSSSIINSKIYGKLGIVVVKEDISKLENKLRDFENMFIIDKDGKIFISSKKKIQFTNLYQYFREIDNKTYFSLSEIKKENVIEIKNERFYVTKEFINSEMWSIVYLKSFIDINESKALGYIVTSALIIILILVVWSINQANKILALALQHKAILDSAKSIIIISTNSQGDIILYGQGMQDITGYKIEEFSQKGYFGKIFFDKKKKPINFNKVVSSFTSSSLEWFCRRKDGKYILILMYIVPQFSMDGKLIGYIFSGVDISKTKRVEDALEQQLKFLQILIDNIPVSVYYKDADMHLIGCNKVFENLLEHSRNDMMGMTSEDIYYDKNIGSMDLKTDMQILKGISSMSYEVVLNSKKIGSRNIVFYKTAFKTHSGKFRGVIGVLIDVTKERKMRTERDKLQVNLIQQNKLASLGELAGSIAHELNNPLTIILGFTQVLMKDKNLSSDAAKSIKNIYDAAQRSQSIIKNMLEFARTDSLRVQKTNLNNIVKATLLIIEKDFYKANIEIIKNLTDSSALVSVNPMQIQQVFLNIMLNAKDAMPEGGKIIITTIVEENKYILSISDTGTGIEKGNLSKIFDPFFTTKEIGKGTGLGLSICYGIVKGFNGEISVESTVGKGTIFYVTFSVAE
jgi:PAS domain S-box-containing protein